jgi:hypothetical protein
MATGTVIFDTGITLPDKYGAFWREIWVGPFDSARQALQARVGLA